jgi:Rieske Fe-S protein
MASPKTNDPSPNPSGVAESHGVSRRRIVNLILGGGLLTTLGSIVVPIINFIIPPKVEESAQNSVVAAKVGDLTLNSGTTFRFGSKPGILIYTQAGEYVAFAATCTHLDCTVQYRADFKHIWCACHNGHFDLTGKNIAGPPPRPLELYKVDIREDDIVVSRGA